MLLSKWKGPGNNILKQGMIAYYTYFYYNTIDSYRRNDGEPLYDIYFSENRIFIHNTLIPKTPHLMDERSMFLKLQQYHKHKTIYDNLRYTYKIHLQPKSDKIVEVVERILSMVSSDDILANYIQDIKFMTYMALRKLNSQENKEDIPNLPVIVVYVKPLFNHTETEIQNVMNHILNAFVNEFNDADELGNFLEPRYNYKINNLIYYAQGHGLLKEMIFNSEDANMIKLLDAESNYSHFNCAEISYVHETCQPLYKTL